VSRPKRIAIAGGGICGLSAAYYLERIMAERGEAWEIRLFEESDSLGGVIRTQIRDGFVLDLGPDALFKMKPAAEILAREIGLGDQLVSAIKQELPTMIYSGGRLHPLPEGLELMAPTRVLPLLASGLLTTKGKLRMLMEPFVPARRDGTEESIAEFVGRRFGREALEKIAGPLLAGIHAGDPARLSMTGTFPRLPEMERAHGSIARAIQKARAARRKAGGRGSGGGAGAGPPFLSFKRGLSTLVDRLAGAIQRASLETGNGIRSVSAAGTGPEAGYRLQLADGSSWEADICILCLPGEPARRVLAALDAEASKLAGEVRYVSTAAAYLGYGPFAEGVELPPTTGFLIPPGDHPTMFGCTFVSNKFPGRAPEGSFLIRAFFGGGMRPRAMELSDEEMIAEARRVLSKLFGLNQEPVFTTVQRWERSNPQYEVGHAARVRELLARLEAYPGLYLTGSGFLGVGVPDGVALGKGVAEQAGLHLSAGPEAAS